MFAERVLSAALGFSLPCQAVIRRPGDAAGTERKNGSVCGMVRAAVCTEAVKCIVCLRFDRERRVTPECQLSFKKNNKPTRGDGVFLPPLPSLIAVLVAFAQWWSS